MLTLSSAELQALAGAWGWPFLRVLALVAAAPVFGHRAVPARVKVGLALALTALVAPLLPPAPPLDAPGAFVILLEQIAIGIALALAMHLAFAAVALAGDAIGLQMGLSFATFVDPQHAAQTPMLGTFLALLATLVFFAIDGHLLLLAALVESFRVAPVGAGALGRAHWGEVAAWGAQLFRTGLAIALPVLAAMLACNLALAVLARAAPQLHLFAVGFPVTLLVGLAALAFFLPWLAPPLAEALRAALEPWLP